MKKAVLIICALSTVVMGFTQKQLDDCYDVSLENSLEYDIDFYSNGNYKISISEQVVPNVKDITILSSGRYTMKRNLISLFDSCIGFQIQCERKGNKLKVIKGFPFMLQHLLNLYGNTFDSIDIRCNTESMQIQNERNKYKQTHPDKYPLYYSRYANGSYVLEIKKGNKYTLVFKGLLLAEGIWKRHGNELSLFDESIQHTFYVLISEEGLTGKYLPGNFSDLLLYESNYPKKKEISFIHSMTHQTPAFDKMNPEEPLHFVEEMPTFPQGGEKAMLHFIKENTRYPESARKAGVKGRVILKCVIEKDGSISTVTVMKKLSPECDEESVRVIKSMPKWIPGQHKGVNVSVKYTIAVDFGKE
jgi:TonB family protein